MALKKEEETIDITERLAEIEKVKPPAVTGAVKTAVAPPIVAPPVEEAAAAGAVRPKSFRSGAPLRTSLPGKGILSGLTERLAFDAEGVGGGYRGSTPTGKGFMDVPTVETVAPAVTPAVEAEIPVAEPAAATATGAARGGFVQGSAPTLTPPTQPKSTGNVTADLVNLGLYNRRMSSYNKQVSAAAAAKRTATEFGVQEKRRGMVAEAQVSESDVRKRMSFAGKRPDPEDLKYLNNAALLQKDVAAWEKRYNEAPVTGGAIKTTGAVEDYAKYK